eukprot:TRINITY_DN22530_c0_g2_i1.p1 TRINITY_DN22530_c0_g2~~TRINITY_DN22530_c0_g2_i1.p1  ORF type:complete len:1435 (+),score=380.84 TRINITY_DN22530_c0_g2_i1:69-4373(+)
MSPSMGKKPAASSASVASAKSAAATGKDGDRPPRPSPGHKWDEEKKQWVGKGSLDERKAAKLKDSGPKELADGTVLKSWQSMPSTLLDEWAKREKRPRPQYRNARSWDMEKWHKRVILPDPKNDANSLNFSPWDDSETEAAAREHAALLALLKVQGDLPLERKLPEPYCDIWKATQAENKPDPKAKAKGKAKAEPKAQPKAQATSSTSAGGAGEAAAQAAEGEGAFVPPLRASSEYSSKAERDAAYKQRTAERNKREAIREQKRRANLPAPILLSKKMRQQLYDILGLQQEYEASVSTPEVDMDDVDAAAMTRCIEWGFDANDVMRAIAATKAEGFASNGRVDAMAEKLRQWLCLHVPEDELPEEFAAGRGQMTVHTAQSVAASNAAKTDKAQRKQAAEPKQSEFERQRNALLAWLSGQLKEKLDESTAEALQASVEAVLCGIEPSPGDDEEAEEAGENAAIIVSEESDSLAATGEDLKQRWSTLWAARTEQVEQPADKQAGDTGNNESGKTEGFWSDDDEATTVGDDRASEVTTAVDGEEFWENGAERSGNNTDTKSAAATAGSRWGKRGSGAAEGGTSSGGSSSSRWFGSSAGSADSLAAENTALRSSSAQRIAKVREGLPAAKSKDELMRLCKEHAVVLVQGETGCGKTTQVGQFLLEHDQHARVVVTQPRRVAATSVAQRVAEERGERLGEGSVGYSVRGDHRLRRDRCRLLFCTNGILLRRLLGEPSNMFSEQTCTHLVIDEVHERSVEIDLLLTLLHHMLPKRPKLRVVLMSATMDTQRLSAMFPGKPPVVKMPGRTFPVEQLFADDVSDQLGIQGFGGSFGWKSSAARSPDAGDDEGGETGSGGPRFLPSMDFGKVAEVALAALRKQLRAPTGAAVPDDGAVLIFVPGVGEIERVSRELQHRMNKSEAYVLPLHGGLAADQQRRCFDVPAKGGPRKIVVSTNVAETSVTVPDVTVVVDTARERRLVLEPGAAAPCLAEAICAQSSLKQRRGRAGRVRAGLCVTLLGSSEYEKLPYSTPPEIESAPLESLCLQVRVAGFDPRPFLAKMPTAPLPARVDKAERMLTKVGATQQREAGGSAIGVSALGRHLAALPCDVHIGKLLVVGAFLGVASMAVDVASMLSVRSPLKNVAKDPKAAEFREQLRQSLRPGGTRSDHCLYAKLMQLWCDARGSQRRELCQNAALAWERMAEATSTRSQLVNALRGLGFDVAREGDRCAGEWRALRVAVTAAFYPEVARVRRPAAEYSAGIGGAIEKKADSRKLHYFVQKDATLESTASEPHDYNATGWRANERQYNDIRAFLHPASMLFKETSYSCPYVVFSTKQVQQTRSATTGYSSRLNLSDASEASIYALLLFGGRLAPDHSNNMLTIDDWITFSGGSTTVVALVERLRTEIDKLLMRKVEQPWLQLGDVSVCQAVSTLLSTDGLG